MSCRHSRRSSPGTRSQPLGHTGYFHCAGVGAHCPGNAGWANAMRAGPARSSTSRARVGMDAYMVIPPRGSSRPESAPIDTGPRFLSTGAHRHPYPPPASHHRGAPMHLHAVDIVIIVAYLCLSVFVGYWVSSRASTDIRSYFLGGNTMPWYVL